MRHILYVLILTNAEKELISKFSFIYFVEPVY